MAYNQDYAHHCSDKIYPSARPPYSPSAVPSHPKVVTKTVIQKHLQHLRAGQRGARKMHNELISIRLASSIFFQETYKDSTWLNGKNVDFCHTLTIN